MKLIIAGGNYFLPDVKHWEWLDRVHARQPVSEVVCGMDDTTERFGRVWATARGIPVAKFPVDWGRYDKAAGTIRNGQMADHTDAVVLFPGGRFTASMYKKSLECGLTILDWRDRS